MCVAGTQGVADHDSVHNWLTVLLHCCLLKQARVFMEQPEFGLSRGKSLINWF